MQNNKLSLQDIKLLEAINTAYKNMLERKARLGEEVVTADENGVVRSQNAKDVYIRTYGDLKPV